MGVDNEEVDDWYRHREWRPEQKQEFHPTRIEAETLQKPAHVPGSAWNVGGTWEEKNMMQWWIDRLSSTRLNLQEKIATIAMVKQVGGITGDASIVYVRGTPRFCFDVQFQVDFAVPGNDGEGCDLSGCIKVSDFSDSSWENVQANIEAPSRLQAIANAELLPFLKEELTKCVKDYQTLA